VDNISDSCYELDRMGLATGIYLLEIEGERIFRGKIVVE
jgi:hypothetical protein